MVDTLNAGTPPATTGGRFDLGALSAAASNGNLDALAELGARLFNGVDAPFSPADGLQLLEMAALRGHPQAAELCAVASAAGVGGPLIWDAALDRLMLAARLGETRAAEQLSLLTSDRDAAAALKSRPADVSALQSARAAVDLAAWAAPPEPEILSEAPRVRLYRDFASHAVCDWIAERARGRFRRAAVYDEARGGGTADPNRDNSAADFSVLHLDLIFLALQSRIAAVTGMPIPHMETPSVLHYAPGEQFRPHVDYLTFNMPGLAQDFVRRGQRVATVLVYLNDDYDGGETSFPRLDLSVKGRKGDALLFFNVQPLGEPDPMTLHSGTPTTRGVKQVLSQWVRDRPQPGRVIR